MSDIEKVIETLEFRRRFYLCGPGDCPCKYKNLCDEKVENQKEKLYKACVPAIEALEKQIPKKTIEDNGYICPTCKGGFLYPPYINPNKHASCNYCNECGQKLDWEVQNES